MYKIMAVNAGSSSLKFQLLEMTKASEIVLTEGIFEKIGQPEPIFTIKYDGKKETKLVPEVKNHGDSVAMLLSALVEKGIVKDLNEIIDEETSSKMIKEYQEETKCSGHL